MMPEHNDLEVCGLSVTMPCRYYGTLNQVENGIVLRRPVGDALDWIV